MTWDPLKSNWQQLKGKGLATWGRLTNDDWNVIRGEREQLIGKLQELYDLAEREAERQVQSLEDWWYNRDPDEDAGPEEPLR